MWPGADEQKAATPLASSARMRPMAWGSASRTRNEMNTCRGGSDLGGLRPRGLHQPRRRHRSPQATHRALGHVGSVGGLRLHLLLLDEAVDAFDLRYQWVCSWVGTHKAQAGRSQTRKHVPNSNL